MKILLLADGMRAGGAETHIETLAHGLRARGHAVALLSFGGTVADRMARDGFPVFAVPRIGFNPVRFFAARRRLVRLVRAEKYDLLHAHTRITALLSRGICGACGRKSQKIPRVVTVHARFRVNPLLRLFCNWGDRTVAVSEDLRAYVSDVYGVPAECVDVIPNGIDLSRFRPAPARPSGAPLHVLFVSRMDADCSLGAFLLCEAAEKLGVFVDLWRRNAVPRADFSGGSRGETPVGRGKAPPEDQGGHAVEDCTRGRAEAAVSLPPFRITLAGGGTCFREVARCAEQANRAIGRPVVSVVDPSASRADLPVLYRAADVFVGVSRAAMEAAASGCAVILCGNEGYGGVLTRARPDLAAGNFCCRGEPCADLDRLFSDLFPLLSDKSLRAAAQADALAVIRRDFSSAEMCRLTEQTYCKTSEINLLFSREK